MILYTIVRKKPMRDNKPGGRIEQSLELVKDKDYAKLSVINHLFKEICEDYDFYNGEDEVSSVLDSLFRYFEKFSELKNAWEDHVDLCDEESDQVLAAAYKQYMLNRVTEAVKSVFEAYRE